MITFVVCLVTLVAAYFLYGRFLERTVGINPDADMPSKTHYDGVSTLCRCHVGEYFLFSYLTLLELARFSVR